MSSGINTARFLSFSAACYPDRPAITWRDTTWTYREFDRRAAAIDTWLRSVGSGRGARVAIFMDNRPEYLAAMFGVFRSGATLVPVNSRLTSDELRYIVEDAGVSVVFVDEAHAETAKAAAPNARVTVAGPELDAILAAEPSGEPPVEVAAEDTAWIFYTSGTTGKPKGAELPHSALDFVTVSWLADLTPMDETDVALHAAPLSHGAGQHAISATARAAHHVITPTTSFDPTGWFDLVNTHGVTNAWLVPTQIVMLTQAAPPDLELPTLKYVVYGGAPITETALQAAIDRFGKVFVQLYAQGESIMTITILRPQDHVPELLASAGRARVGIDVQIVDADDRVLPPGEVGEIVVRGPSVMSGYLNQPEATEHTLRGGWLHTGDLGRLTSDGWLYLLDRAKDMIISGGSNVYAVEVEQALAAHPAVADVAVVGVPDDLWGELVVAVVVPADPGSWDQAELDAHCRQNLAGYKLPRRWELVEELPRNAYGKVVKRDLRESLEGRAG
ncbi:MAG TPA: AMP-binding protein [Pseudonocardia sp.]|jgi:long-chain acyl-CoA synthetase|nr:AMP-binding protein [Pseudonocardia sp.]